MGTYGQASTKSSITGVYLLYYPTQCGCGGACGSGACSCGHSHPTLHPTSIRAESTMLLDQDLCQLPLSSREANTVRAQSGGSEKWFVTVDTFPGGLAPGQPVTKDMVVQLTWEGIEMRTFHSYAEMKKWIASKRKY